MGVRSLQTFLKSINNGAIAINMELEIEIYKSENNGKTPVIIIDTTTFNKPIYENRHERLIGGRFNIFNERAIKIFTKLKSMGIEMIFFMDGPPTDDKIPHMLDKRNEDYSKYVEIFEAIDAGKDLSADFEEIQVPLLTAFVENLCSLSQGFGRKYIATLNENNLELGTLARKWNALAVLTDNTDFLIYNGRFRLWSSRDINLENMTTIEYSRVALRQNLKLSDAQLPLLATLSGNYLLKYEYVQEFHKRICTRGWKFYKIAEIINTLKSKPPRYSKEDFQYVLELVFPDEEERQQRVESFIASLKSYDYNTMVRKHSDMILNKVSKDIHLFNYVILANRKYVIRIAFVDLQSAEFMSFYDLIIPLVRRQMGILLRHLNNDKITRSFYSKKHHDIPYEIYTETPEYPTVAVPPLLDLLSTPYNKKKDLDLVRLRLCCWCISSKLDYTMILKLPKNTAVTALVAFYLWEKKQISKKEADCLIIANNCRKELKDSLKLEDFKQINGRAARIAFLFSRTHSFIANCFHAVGLKTFCSIINFDGLYFHYLWKKWENIPETERLKDIKGLNSLRLYSQFA